ncbi:MAG TPA: ATPase, T2SS/T4P/T4SS family [Steroidobacter sp.]|uniref:ATPase, T2SS/T4P/T4SS family n=1 Tax=Steroidobacter sp. TaxID=1978227 RepID=UPI002ED89583
MIEFEINVPGRGPARRRVEFGEYTIGSALMADIRLRHDSVAKQHASLRVSDDDVSLRTVESKTLLKNGVPASSKERFRVGDVFQIGACELRVISSLIEPPAQTFVPQTPPTPKGHATPKPEPVTEAQSENVALPSDELKPLQEKVQELVLRELDLFRRTALNELGSLDLRDEARVAIERIISMGAIQLPPALDRAQFIKDMTAEIMGFGPIEPFLADESISEIMVNGPNCIYVERAGKLTRAPARFINSESLMRVIERIVSPLGRRIDEGVPMVDARLPDGSRVNAIIPPLSLIGPILTIRKFAKRRFSMDRLIEIGALTPQMETFLRVCVHHRKNILVSGGTGSGKTTFLNALSAYIPDDERIVTVEDAAELRLVQPHVLSLEARPANVEGRGEVTIRDLVRNCLRMRPDRIIVGECRGGEALDMLQAMNTGHDGSMTTGHANSPRDLLSRLEVMVLMAGMDLPVRAIREQISSAVNIIVQLTRFSDGRRRVVSIVEVDGMEGDVILTQPLFAFQQRGIGANGEVFGEHVGFGQAPHFYEELKNAGIPLDNSIFGTPPRLDG